MQHDGAFINAEEDLAAMFLRLTGVVIVARNTRNYGAEIDLLCRDDRTNEYLFCEVKRRRHGASTGYPVLPRAQQLRLKDAALGLIAAAGKFLPVRICLVLVDKRLRSVELITDVV